MRTDKEIDNAFKPDGITDNRMQWLMKRNGIKGVTMSWAGNPCIMYEDGMVLPEKADRIMLSDYYKNDNDWPICPLTDKKLPIARITRYN